MKTNKENLINSNAQLVYVAPRITKQNVELEYSVAAGSVHNNSITESWQTETQSQDVEW
ncbi:hypothetical protein [Sphingobacterium multivorum]|uniref:Uncharacterized protein n=1 Tax=Sphingobacterium multivorum TaxID=28454 RepID=A0ABX7CM65_SPHMU|nr:hypothetical protein [Sphingobacterium multivorum]QQT53132.1 hypothetical protein I6I98_23280 [Sphingobacterium multivorum]